MNYTNPQRLVGPPSPLTYVETTCQNLEMQGTWGIALILS